jgi:RNA polymerase sigma-70 factor (ECF subfamily)
MGESMLKRTEGSTLNEAIRSVLRGDSEAFAFIYRSYYEVVRRICSRVLRDPAEAEDAAQDAFVTVFLKINTFRGESAFSSWLYRLTMNVVLMRLRRNNRFWKPPRNRMQDSSAPSTEIDFPDLRVSDPLGRIELQAAIDDLPAGYKAAFILHDVHGYRHKEIAAICGYSIGNSRSQLHKARMRLRTLLADSDREQHLAVRLKADCVN